MGLAWRVRRPMVAGYRAPVMLRRLRLSHRLLTIGFLGTWVLVVIRLVCGENPTSDGVYVVYLAVWAACLICDRIVRAIERRVGRAASEVADR